MMAVLMNAMQHVAEEPRQQQSIVMIQNLYMAEKIAHAMVLTGMRYTVMVLRRQ